MCDLGKTKQDVLFAGPVARADREGSREATAGQAHNKAVCMAGLAAPWHLSRARLAPTGFL
jgi:hypothetical protein